MRKYYKLLNELGELVLLLIYDFEPSITDPLMIEITEEEYNALLAEIIENRPETEPTEIELKAKAYDIVTGVSE